MKLVEFEVSKKKNVFINPRFVSKAERYNDDKAIIYLATGQVNVVLCPIDEVVRKLTTEEL